MDNAGELRGELFLLRKKGRFPIVRGYGLYVQKFRWQKHSWIGSISFAARHSHNFWNKCVQICEEPLKTRSVIILYKTTAMAIYRVVTLQDIQVEKLVSLVLILWSSSASIWERHQLENENAGWHVLWRRFIESVSHVRLFPLPVGHLRISYVSVCRFSISLSSLGSYITLTSVDIRDVNLFWEDDGSWLFWENVQGVSESGEWD